MVLNCFTFVPLNTLLGSTVWEGLRVIFLLAWAVFDLSCRSINRVRAAISMIPFLIRLLLLFALASVFWSTQTLDGMRFYVKLIFPYAVGLSVALIISEYAREEMIERWIKISFWLFTVLSLSMFLFTGDVFAPSQDGRYYGWGEIHITKSVNFFFAVFFGACCLVGSFRSYGLHFLVAAGLVFGAGQRSIFMGLLVAIWALSFLKYRRKAMFGLILIPIVFGTLTVSSETLRSRMFLGETDPQDVVRMEDITELMDIIQTHGRLDAWTTLIDTYFEVGNVWFGNGWGSSIVLFTQDFPGLTLIHNDYLMLLYDVGIVGLLTYLVGSAQLIKRSYYGFTSARSRTRRIFFATCYSGFVGLALTALTDNVIIFSPYHVTLLIALFIVAQAMEKTKTAKAATPMNPERE